MKCKIMAMLFALMALAVIYTSCSDGSTAVNNNGSSSELVEEYENDDIISGLSDERYDGYNYRIFLRKGHKNGQYLEEDSEDVVESAVYRRNKLVEERYGIKISATESSSGNYETDALNGILAGDDAYDLILPHSRAAMTYALQGAVYNINDISTINLDKPYWAKDLRDTFEINGSIYFLDGDISTSLGSAMCMLFNKRIFDELGFDYPYELVRDGEWTFDEFAYLAKKGGKDLDGDGIMTPENDRFGYYDSDWYGPIEMIYTGGQKIYDKNDAGELELTLYSNKTVEIFDEYFSLMENDSCFLNITELPSSYSGNMFGEGRAMLSFSELGSAKSYRGMDDDFGIIPFPKFSEDDEYAAIINAFASVGVIPITVSDVERTGAITEALCAYGSREVIPAFYDVSLKTKSARDEDSEEMMDIIKDSIVYDIGYVAGGAFSSTGYSLARLPGHDFASFYATNEGAAKSYIDEFNEGYAGSEN